MPKTTVKTAPKPAPKPKCIRCPHCNAALDQATLKLIHGAVARQFSKLRINTVAGPGRKSILKPCPFCKRKLGARERRVHEAAHRRGEKCPQLTQPTPAKAKRNNA